MRIQIDSFGGVDGRATAHRHIHARINLPTDFDCLKEAERIGGEKREGGKKRGERYIDTLSVENMREKGLTSYERMIKENRTHVHTHTHIHTHTHTYIHTYIHTPLIRRLHSHAVKHVKLNVIEM